MLSCFFVNDCDHLRILRCKGPEHFFLERVLFPFDSCAFEAPTDAEVELWGSESVLEDSMSVALLQISPIAADPGCEEIPPAVLLAAP